MKLSKTKLHILAVGILLLLAAPTARPQDTGGDPTHASLLDVSFRGGSAAEYLDMLKRTAGNQFNVIVPPEVAEVTIPEVQLRQVSVTSAIKLLDGRTTNVRPGRLVRLSVSMLPIKAHGERPTFQVNVHVQGSRRAENAHVWTLRSLLDNGFESAALLSAVEMALEAMGSTTPLDVRFHEDTGLLIATGDDAQLGTIDEVIARLRDSVEERFAQEIAKTELDAVHEINALRNEIARLEMLNDQLRHMLEQKDQEIAVLHTQLRRERSVGDRDGQDNRR